MSTSTLNFDDSVREEMIEIANVRTSVLKVGHLKESPSKDEERVLMLIIPGNPGVPYYYENFMQELYSHCEGQIPVWIVGHAGHVQPPGSKLYLNDVYSTSEKLYGLEAQVFHKLQFIKNHVPEDVKLILIGHSIGCYMILNLLDHLEKYYVLRCFMLFPTIERMSSSPSGIKLTPILRYLRWIVIFIALLLSFIPKYFQVSMVKWCHRKVDCPPCTIKAVLATLTPWTVNFTTYLAKLEMNQVTILQRELIKKYANKLSFYYGSQDHWAPHRYYLDLKEQFPYLDARLCTLNLKHAFVLDMQEGREMAKIVWLWAQSHHHTILLSCNEVKEESWVFDT